LGSDIELNFLNWLTAYGHNQEWWSIFDKGFVNSQVIFSFSEFSLFINASLTELNIQGKHYQPGDVNPAYVVFHLFVLTTIIAEVLNLLKGRIADHRMKNIRIILLVWLIPFFIFNQFFCAFWINYKLFFQVPLLAIWTLLILESAPRERKSWNVIVLIVLVCMGVWNVIFGMIPDSKISTNPILAETYEIKPFLRDGDLIIFARNEKYKASLVRYYTEADATFFQINSTFILPGSDTFDELSDTTLEFLFDRYDRIILSGPAGKSGFTKWIFPAHTFPPPHPGILAVRKSDLLHYDSGDETVVMNLSDIMKKNTD